MKYFKSLLLVIIFSNVLSAYDLYRGKCIENYYWSGSSFNYYHKYLDTANSTLISEPLANFDLTQLDTNHNYKIVYYSCKIDTNQYGLSTSNYNFLLALIGILIGFTFMFFMTYTFINISNPRK